MRRAKKPALTGTPQPQQGSAADPGQRSKYRESPQLVHWSGGMLWRMVTFMAGLPWSKGNAKLRRMQN